MRTEAHIAQRNMLAVMRLHCSKAVYQGGELVVHHASHPRVFDHAAANATSICCTAFYAGERPLNMYRYQ